MPESAERRHTANLEAITRILSVDVLRAVRPALAALREREEREAAAERVDALEDSELIRQIEGVTLRLGETIPDILVDQAAREAGAAVSEHNARELGRVLGVDPRQSLDQPQITGFIRQNTALIRDLTRGQMRIMREEVEAALLRGTGSRELTRIIEHRLGVTRNRARLIARDQITKLQGNLNMARQQRAGVTEYDWVTSNDERVRGRVRNKNGTIKGKDRHWQLHGTRQRWDRPPVVSTTGRRAHPGEDIQCRCQAIPIVTFDVEDPEESLGVEAAGLIEPPVAPQPPRVSLRRPRPRGPRRQGLRPVEGVRGLLVDVQLRLQQGQSVRIIARDLGIPIREVRLIAERLGMLF